jgi:hypothetical protein
MKYLITLMLLFSVCYSQKLSYNIDKAVEITFPEVKLFPEQTLNYYIVVFKVTFHYYNETKTFKTNSMITNNDNVVDLFSMIARDYHGFTSEPINNRKDSPEWVTVTWEANNGGQILKGSKKFVIENYNLL